MTCTTLSFEHNATIIAEKWFSFRFWSSSFIKLSHDVNRRVKGGRQGDSVVWLQSGTLAVSPFAPSDVMFHLQVKLLKSLIYLNQLFLFFFVLFCFFCFVLFCFVLFCFVLFCFVLFCFVLFCFVLFWIKRRFFYGRENFSLTSKLIVHQTVEMDIFEDNIDRKFRSAKRTSR